MLEGTNSTICVSSCLLFTKDILLHSKIKDIVHIDFKWLTHSRTRWWNNVFIWRKLLSSYLFFFLENFWSKHFFTAMSHLTTAYACSQMSARHLVVYCLIELHFDVLPHGTDILVSNVLLILYLCLWISEIPLIYGLLVGLWLFHLYHASSFMVY